MIETRSSLLLAAALIAATGCERQQRAPTETAAAPAKPALPANLAGRYRVELGKAADRDAPGGRWLYLDLSATDDGLSGEAWRPDGQELSCGDVAFRRGELTATIARSYAHDDETTVEETWALKTKLRGEPGHEALRGVARVTIVTRVEGVEEVRESSHRYTVHSTRADGLDRQEVSDAYSERMGEAQLRAMEQAAGDSPSEPEPDHESIYMGEGDAR